MIGFYNYHRFIGRANV